jgi:tRNA dimethylallyltransferase
MAGSINQNPRPLLVVICGATASGKTSCAIRLAEHYQTEILSTDSRQIYRELEIGTAKPTPGELKRATQHFIGSISIQDDYSAGQYERDALALLDVLFRDHPIVIAAGGTGLYHKALIEGLDDIPATDPGIRAEIIEEYRQLGLEHLQRLAGEADPESYALMDTQNPQRLMRLIEVYRATDRPRSSFFTVQPAIRPFDRVSIGLEVDRKTLYRRIDRRVEDMMEAGLLEEVKSLLPFRDLNALQTVGYCELIDHLDGKTTLEEAVALIQRNSRRYAKRQLTWFRKDPSIRWFDPEDLPGMIQTIDRWPENTTAS